MLNIIANSVRIFGICKDFAGDFVNELGNVPGCGVVPKFSDLEAVALSIAAEADVPNANYLLPYTGAWSGYAMRLKTVRLV